MKISDKKLAIKCLIKLNDFETLSKLEQHLTQHEELEFLAKKYLQYDLN